MEGRINASLHFLTLPEQLFVHYRLVPSLDGHRLVVVEPSSHDLSVLYRLLAADSLCVYLPDVRLVLDDLADSVGRPLRASHGRYRHVVQVVQDVGRSVALRISPEDVAHHFRVLVRYRHAALADSLLVVPVRWARPDEISFLLRLNPSAIQALFNHLVLSSAHEKPELEELLVEGIVPSQVVCL